MAGRIVTITSAALVTLGTGTVNQALIVAGANTPVKIKRMGLSPTGTSNADPRIQFQLTKDVTATAGATPMTVGQSGGHSQAVGSLQTTGTLAPTSVSGGTVVKGGVFLPNGPYEIPVNIDLNAGAKLLLTTTVATTQDVRIWFELEE